MTRAPRARATPARDYSVDAIDRALRILLLFAEQKRELGISEIADALSLQKSTVHRAVLTLKERGFLDQNPVNQKYWLGIRTFTLGMLYSVKLELRTLARPYMEKLARKLGEAVHLAVLDRTSGREGRIVVLDRIENQQILSIRIGYESEAHCSGVGKTLLAYSPPDLVNRVIKERGLRRYTPNTITTAAGLERELERIREEGCAIDREEIEIGLTCVAAPIRNHQGEVVAAVSLSGPITRITPDRYEEIIREVKETAWEISQRIGPG